MTPRAYEGDYQGEKAVWLQAGGYEAVLLPEIGANLIALRDLAHGAQLLREPGAGEMTAFREKPFVHGIPVLFPPNRFENGKFPWNKATYSFPVNEEATGNHLHGFLYDQAWTVEGYGTTPQESYVTVNLRVDEAHPVYRHWPHRFTMRLRYALSADGLAQQVFIRNEGEAPMPCLFAFHTTINAPFASGSTARDCRVKLTIGERWALNERMLPTGIKQPLTAEEQALQGEGVYPFFAAMDNHYTARPQNGRNRMELTDTRVGRTLVYDVGTSYKQWMIWNNFATEGFFCPEPQVSLVNAPHVDLPAEEIGLFSLAQGEIWEESARLYMK
ncbi:aldose 1-epimerase [Paenibacillus sp. IB182496]|uniref:Aldose 1-epimerase n=1 Tax=Paenibacillus sabuli TaxID=2772509 RepID=A0A927BSA8_9BACL|nr:aldose 1-epimerase [Paenibacillus sabuli]MBD2844835.1 aldose 1-epimerase [Paenibacillus sabuli]